MAPGQVLTTRMIAGSGVQSSRLAAAEPATRPSASAISRTLVRRAGKFMAVSGPQYASVVCAARIKPSIVRPGDDSATATSAGTGQTAR
jgi:hypothetical protein